MQAEITTISGPVSLSIFEYNQTRYYFFGDTHFSNANLCHDDNYISINELLPLWFTYNNNHQIKTDFYFESAFTKEELTTTKDLLSHVGPLPLVYNALISCLSKNKSQCPYQPYVHIHYANIRLFKDENKYHRAHLFNLESIYNFYKNYQFKSLQQFLIVQNNIIQYIDYQIQNYKTILEGLLQPSQYFHVLNNILDLIEPFDKQLKNNILLDLYYVNKLTVIRQGQKIHRVAAELQKLAQIDNTMANNIYDYGFYLANHYLEEYPIDENIFNHFFNEFNEQLKNKNTTIMAIGHRALLKYINYFKPLFTQLASTLMDIYTLARMMYYQSDEVITYSGYNHAMRYHYFFENYLNTTPVIEITPTFVNKEVKHHEGINRCLSHPFLSYYIPVQNFK